MGKIITGESTAPSSRGEYLIWSVDRRINRCWQTYWPDVFWVSDLSIHAHQSNIILAILILGDVTLMWNLLFYAHDDHRVCTFTFNAINFTPEVVFAESYTDPDWFIRKRRSILRAKRQCLYIDGDVLRTIFLLVSQYHRLGNGQLWARNECLLGSHRSSIYSLGDLQNWTLHYQRTMNQWVNYVIANGTNEFDTPEGQSKGNPQVVHLRRQQLGLLRYLPLLLLGTWSAEYSLCQNWNDFLGSLVVVVSMHSEICSRRADIRQHSIHIEGFVNILRHLASLDLGIVTTHSDSYTQTHIDRVFFLV